MKERAKNPFRMNKTSSRKTKKKPKAKNRIKTLNKGPSKEKTPNPKRKRKKEKIKKKRTWEKIKRKRKREKIKRKRKKIKRKRTRKKNNINTHIKTLLPLPRRIKKMIIIRPLLTSWRATCLSISTSSWARVLRPTPISWKIILKKTKSNLLRSSRPSMASKWIITAILQIFTAQSSIFS